MSENDDLERRLSELLEDGEMEQADRQAKEIRQISPKYEIRIQTTLDPIVEETLRYRKIAYELDDRYDKYVKRSDQSHSPQNTDIADHKKKSTESGSGEH